MRKIRAIIKRPDEQWGHVTNISDTLENLQKTVGGYIETVTMGNIVIICDEEARLKEGCEFNCRIPANSPYGTVFYGTIVVLGVSGEEFDDCPLDFKYWKRFYLGR